MLARPDRRTLLALALALFGAACARLEAQDAPPPPPAPAVVRPVTVFLVRHAEKADEPGSDPGLSPAGEARAAELARVLDEAGVTHLFATPYERTRRTLAPLARARGLEVADYDPRDLDALALRLAALPPHACAVVAGHSNTTPALFERLGGAPAELVEVRGTRMLDEAVYDRLYVAVIEADAAGGLRTHAAHELRYGD
ncbi:MAG: histidine phosphatase family protein [Planctomycetes bacterium]|nr:histidine phosphatase family protein [Planctomycetota bacterium]